jgi:hypothetical protein
MNENTVIDHLEEDFIQIPSQRYALISVVSPLSTQKFETCALKIRGVFSNEDEAKRHATKLSKTDTTFDVYLVDMYKWLPIPPPSNDLIEDRVYQETVLNDLIQGHKEQQVLVKQHFEERKQDSILNPVKITPKIATNEKTDNFVEHENENESSIISDLVV